MFDLDHFKKVNDTYGHAVGDALLKAFSARLSNTVRASDTVVALYEDYRHVYTHARAMRPGERRTVADHLPPHARAFFERDRRWCVQQAQRVVGCEALLRWKRDGKDRYKAFQP